MSFARKVLRSRSGDVCLIVAPVEEDLKLAWYFIAPHPGKADLLIEAVEAGPVRLTDFGHILKSGYGDAPPPDVMAAMTSEYGFET